MKYLKLFEEYKLLLEIGDQSAKPFKWSAKEDAGKEMMKEWKKLKPGQHASLTYEYTFKNDEGVDYVVLFTGTVSRRLSFSFGGGERPMSELYDSGFNLAYNTKEDHSKGVETETGLGHVYRIMSTVAQIISDFLKKAESADIPVKELLIGAKGDGSSDGMDSRRGRLYLNYIKRGIKKLGTKSSYTAILQPNSQEVSVVLGDRSDENIIESKG